MIPQPTVSRFVSRAMSAPTPVEERASIPCLRHHGYASASQIVSMPASSIARADASISSSGSIVSCITPMRKGGAITPILSRPVETDQALAVVVAEADEARVARVAALGTGIELGKRRRLGFSVGSPVPHEPGRRFVTAQRDELDVRSAPSGTRDGRMQLADRLIRRHQDEHPQALADQPVHDSEDAREALPDDHAR